MTTIVDETKELKATISDLKARNSALSRDLDLRGRDVKAAQDKAAQVDGLKDEIAGLKADLKEANAAIASAAADADAARVSASRDAKRAAAYKAIRDALETK